MSAINYQLDSQGRVVDSQGRVLVGLDGVAIQVAGITTAKNSSSNSSASTKSSSTVSSCSQHKTGDARSTLRPKAPQDWAMDFPLGTIKEGASAGTLWYCGEFHCKNGTLTKRWWLFSDEEERAIADVSKLEKLAWQLIERKRASGSLDGSRGEFLSREQDAAQLAALEVPPSVTFQRVREAVKRVNKKQRKQQAKSEAVMNYCKKGVRKALGKTI